MKGEKSVGLLLGLGKPEEGAESEQDTKKLAAKAMFKALKRDDFEDFYEALGEYMEECLSEGEDDEEG